MTDNADDPKRPGVARPWSDKLAELPTLTGDTTLARKAWEQIDDLAYQYIWYALIW